MSSSSEEQQHQQENKPVNTNNQQSPDTYYQRKKNWIGGIDNDTLLGLGVAAAIGIGGIAAYPMLRQAWDNFTQRVQQQNQYVNPYQPPNNQEAYIPPTEPVEQVPPPPPPVVTEPVEEEKTEEKKQEEENDGVWYEQELKRKQKLMNRKPTGSKYDSPFGRDIGGLG